MNHPASLIANDGLNVRRFNLHSAIITIGRDPANSIFLNDPKVSWKHAEIIRSGEGLYEIRDVGALNPIRVNGQKVSAQKLKNGDQIKLGDGLFIFDTESPNNSVPIDLATPEAPSEKIDIDQRWTSKTVLQSARDWKEEDYQVFLKDHRRLMLLYRFGEIINSRSMDYRLLIEEIMNAALRVLNARRGLLALADEKTGELRCEISMDEEGNQEGGKFEFSRSIVYKVFRGKAALISRNALKEDSLKNIQSVCELGLRSTICSPIFAQGKVLGVIYLDNRREAGSFQDDDLVFLSALCNQVGIALWNTQLYRNLIQENRKLEEALLSEYNIIAEDPRMKILFTEIKRIAPKDITVLIRGETGTGKELVVKAIHGLSPRRDKPCIAFNCAAIAEHLVESELFGHEKGAFTGAISARAGKFEMAHNGTLFLDEIGCMSLGTQAKFLRVLQERSFERVGGNKTIQVNVRVVSATSQDLEKAIREGRFREDLFYRLNVVQLEIPSLRERKKDILPLAEYFIQGRELTLSGSVKQILENFEWPGNVRELKNCLERAVVFSDGRVIQPEDIPGYIRRGGESIPVPLESLEQVEKDHIIRVLRCTQGSKSKAADILKVSRQALYDKIQRLQIACDEAKSNPEDIV
ncbi:MAG: sigma 54-interacting transcriptional regulator [Calditrichota bacterium]